MSGQAGRAENTASDIAGAFVDAAFRIPAEASGPNPWLPANTLWRAAVVAGWSLVAMGLAAGTIPLLIIQTDIPVTLAIALALLQTLPLAGALWYPIEAWRLMTLAMALIALCWGLFGDDAAGWPWPPPASVAMLLALIVVGSVAPRRTLFAVGVLTAIALAVPVPATGTPIWAAWILTGGAVMALIFGATIGSRRTVQALLEEQTKLRREDLARQAVLEERGRIARELHDVVAHHMSMIAIQAEAAPIKVPDTPPAAAEIFLAINRAARDALAETRKVVGLLRSDDEAAARAPVPGLELLDTLVDRAGDAGLAIESVVLGVPRPLTASVDVSAYRIAQEALSNAARYAPGSTVRVEINYGADALKVAVLDDGRSVDAEPSAEPGGGHGLVGMRERAAMLGGVVEAGPRTEGGFAVTATLPYDG